MLGGQTMEGQAVEGGTLIPIQFDELVLVVTPVFKVLAHTQGTNYLFHSAFQLDDCLVIQVIPVVVRNEEKVDLLRHILGFVKVGPRKGTIDEGNGRAFVEHRVSEDGLPVQAKQKRAMPEPKVKVARFRQKVQIGLDNRNLTQLWDSILRLFSKEELPKILQHAAFTCKQRCRFLILELVIHKMRRLSDAFEAFATSGPSKLFNEVRWLHLFVNADNGVFSGSQSDGFSVLDGVGAMLLVDAAEQVGGVVGGGHLLVVDDVDAGLVEGDGVGAGEDAVVFKFHGGGMVDAVAVDTHVVHHTDIDDALSLLEVVRHGLGSCRHAFKEAVLVADELGRPKFGHVEFFHLARRVDISLAVAAGATDAEVLQGTAVAAHWVTFEVVEGNHEVVVGHVSTHDVVFDVPLVLHRNADFIVLVHDIDREVVSETMPADDFPVNGRVVALVLLVTRTVAVGSVALHDGAIYFMHKVFDEFGLQVVGVTPLPCRDFHGHAAFGFHALASTPKAL